MFTKKKKDSETVFYNVGIYVPDTVSDETYMEWDEQLADAADNVGTSELIELAEYDQAVIADIKERFSHVDVTRRFFMINKIDHEAIRKEVEQLEKENKWRKLFGRVSAEEYAEAEDRIVSSPERALCCTNDLYEATRFLADAAKRD